HFPADTELRVAQFTELVATAIANAEARADVERLAEEQAGLRRVATLVAEGGAPTEGYGAVIDEGARLLGASPGGMMRVENAHEVTIVANRGQDPAVVQVGMRLPFDGDSATSRVLRTARSARINFREEGAGTIADLVRRLDVHTSVGTPIMVEGRV